jgi:hypothetical protein
LGVDGVLVVIVGDVELDGRARTVAIEHVVDAGFDIHNQGHGDHHKVQFFAEMVFDEAFQSENGFLSFPAIERAAVIAGKDVLQFVVIADTWTGQIGHFGIRHEETSAAGRVCRKVAGSQYFGHGMM